VLEAMSVPREYQAGALRLSLGYETSGDDVERAISIVPEAVAALREAGVAAVH
jgi:cysteine sulfinate desulfinase/cysteine desulfurase-like protein